MLICNFFIKFLINNIELFIGFLLVYYKFIFLDKYNYILIPVILKYNKNPFLILTYIK